MYTFGKGFMEAMIRALRDPWPASAGCSSSGATCRVILPHNL